MNRAYVYIDGFNLYYGALKGRKGTKWLNLDDWLKKMLPQNEIVKIKYFTSIVSGSHDPSKPIKQGLYLRALQTINNIEIIKGTFLYKNISIQVNKDVKIIGRAPEEKGTDVNIGIHLVNDARKKLFDIAVLVSNDSDLSGAVEIVSKEVGLPVGIINPFPKFNKKLSQYSFFKKIIRENPIKSSQFPNTMNDSNGSFQKPNNW